MRHDIEAIGAGNSVEGTLLTFFRILGAVMVIFSALICWGASS